MLTISIIFLAFYHSFKDRLCFNINLIFLINLGLDIMTPKFLKFTIVDKSNESIPKLSNPVIN